MLGLLTGLLAYAVFYVVVQREEDLLRERYGAAYAAYLAKVPRFFPNPSCGMTSRPSPSARRACCRTFADALVFLLAVPGAEFFEQLQDTGVDPGSAATAVNPELP